jgi:TetR/AcrR family transcriptional regulator, regulator of cefoperazone and chloramphenicol sensitivity
MENAMPAVTPRPTPLQRPEIAGYKKGEETRARILEVALAAFGNDAFDRVTTRQICQEAKITLPSLTYYFGGKEGLYLDCAREILAAYRESVGPTAETARVVLARDPRPIEAAAQLETLLIALAKLLLSSPRARCHAAFVQREISSPGPAFEFLVAELWEPGIELLAALIRHVAPDRFSASDSQVRAFMMMSSLTGFVGATRMVERISGTTDHFDQVVRSLKDQVGALLKSPD